MSNTERKTLHPDAKIGLAIFVMWLASLVYLAATTPGFEQQFMEGFRAVIPWV